ncbi:MAG: hypothetical protein JSR77_07995 [Planctomycetes bacterium]|nr:hypothetical protein [Planctomycetota bacterium]
MPIPILEDNELARCEFKRRYNRPPPWCDLVQVSALDELAWAVGRRLGMLPSSICLDRVCRFAWERMDPPRGDEGAYRGHTELISLASTRLGVPRDGAVYLWRGSENAARLRMRDLIDFEAVLWWDDSWVIDENAAWILAAKHDWPAYWLRLCA